MPWPSRHPSYRRSTPPQPAPSPYSNNQNQYNHNQSVRTGPTTSPGWSPPSNATHAHPQGSRSPRSPHMGGPYRSNTSSYPIAFGQQGHPNLLKDECRAWFITIDQNDDGSLSFQELRSGLLNDGGLPFSNNTINYLMSVFDRDNNGVITYNEFEPLWIYMIEWRRMFDSFDRDHDEKIDAIELGSALTHYGIHVGRHVLEMLVRKYGEIPSRNWPNGYGNVQAQHQNRWQMNLDQFICASVVVRQMCELYEKCNAGGQSQTTRDEFLKCVISLP